jgi:hypothetical protein
MDRSRRLPPRLLAGLAFGAAGMLLTALWFLPVLVRGHGDVVSWLLYVGLPGMAAAIAGAVLGHPLVRPSPPGGDGAAVLRGVAIATVALILFAPLYAWVLKWTEPGWTSVIGLTVLVLEFGALAMWWALAVVGGLVGWGLYRWSRRTFANHAPR